MKYRENNTKTSITKILSQRIAKSKLMIPSATIMIL